MKRLWVINQFANLPSGSGGSRHYSLAKNLKNNNWDTTIIAGSIEHNTGYQRLKSNEKIKLENVEGIDFLWIKLNHHKSFSLRRRALNMIYFFLKLVFFNFNNFIQKPDLIIGSSVTPFAALGGYLLSKRYKVSFIYEVRDLWPKTLIEMKVIKPNSMISKVFDFIDTFLAKRSSKILVLMPGGIEFYKSKGITKKKVFWISNGVDYKKKIEFKKIPEDKSFNITYTGSMGPSNSLETILYAINYLNKFPIYKNNVNLRLIGSGSSKEKLIKIKDELNLENIYFEKPVSKNKIHEILSSSDALILTMNNIPELYKYGISFNKIFDYLLSARPILISSCTKYDPIRSSNSGLISDAGDHISLGKNIIKIINMSETCKSEYGENGRRYVLENFLYQDLANRLSKILNECIKNKK